MDQRQQIGEIIDGFVCDKKFVLKPVIDKQPVMLVEDGSGVVAGVGEQMGS